VDTQKAGLWAGGFFKVQTVTSFGHSIIQDTGAIVPANLAWILPTIEPDTGLQEFTYTHLLSPSFGVYLGKINSIAPTNVLHGDYTTGFLYTGLNFPLALASADLKVKPFGLPGHQNLTFAWSNKDRTSLIQDPANIARQLLDARFPRLGDPGPILIEIFDKLGLPPTAQPLNVEDETWAAVYSFEQFLWQPAGDHKRGIGTFFSAGVSDGKANPIKYSYSLGLVGKGVVPGRPTDDFGIAWARTEFSDNFVPYLRDRLDLGLDHEDAIELYYNASVTPWLSITPSLQIVSPGLNKALDSTGNFKDLDTTYIAGVRVGIRF
jgi:porin